MLPLKLGKGAILLILFYFGLPSIHGCHIDDENCILASIRGRHLEKGPDRSWRNYERSFLSRGNLDNNNNILRRENRADNRPVERVPPKSRARVVERRISQRNRFDQRDAEHRTGFYDNMRRSEEINRFNQRNLNENRLSRSRDRLVEDTRTDRSVQQTRELNNERQTRENSRDSRISNIRATRREFITSRFARDSSSLSRTRANEERIISTRRQPEDRRSTESRQQTTDRRDTTPWLTRNSAALSRARIIEERTNVRQPENRRVGESRRDSVDRRDTSSKSARNSLSLSRARTVEDRTILSRRQPEERMVRESRREAIDRSSLARIRTISTRRQPEDRRQNDANSRFTQRTRRTSEDRRSSSGEDRATLTRRIDVSRVSEARIQDTRRNMQEARRNMQEMRNRMDRLSSRTHERSVSSERRADARRQTIYIPIERSRSTEDRSAKRMDERMDQSRRSASTRRDNIENRRASLYERRIESATARTEVPDSRRREASSRKTSEEEIRSLNREVTRERNNKRRSVTNQRNIIQVRQQREERRVDARFGRRQGSMETDERRVIESSRRQNRAASQERLSSGQPTRQVREDIRYAEKITPVFAPVVESKLDLVTMAKMLLFAMTIAQVLVNVNYKKFGFLGMPNFLNTTKQKVY